jgi:menaquinol-cytochrome c reductase cytochrome b/c subunit
LAHHQSDEKVVYVGDSRVVKKSHPNIPRDYSAYPGKSEAFVPNFLLKEWMVGAVVAFGYMVLTIAHPSPLGYPADPTNTAFIPMPDWYFLFMYQLLKYPYLSDQFVVFGTVILPGLLFGGLTLAPFLDTGKERRFYRRPIASSLMLLSIAATIYLTVVSWNHYTHELEVKGITPEHIERAALLEAGQEPRGVERPSQEEAIAIVDKDDAAYEIYQRATCASCHGQGLEGMENAGFPSLLAIGDKYSEEDLMGIVHNGIGKMPAQYEDNIEKGLTEEEINSLVSWLAKQKAE